MQQDRFRHRQARQAYVETIQRRRRNQDFHQGQTALALRRGCRWPPVDGRPSAEKLYSLKVASFHVPLRHQPCSNHAAVKDGTCSNPLAAGRKSRSCGSPEAAACEAAAVMFALLRPLLAPVSSHVFQAHRSAALTCASRPGHLAKCKAAHFCSISVVRSVGCLRRSSANFGPLLRR